MAEKKEVILLNKLSAKLDDHIQEEGGLVRQMVKDISDVKEALYKFTPYLVMATKRECRREKLQRAIIEKSLVGLAWAVIVGFGVLLYTSAVNFIHSVNSPPPPPPP